MAHKNAARLKYQLNIHIFKLFNDGAGILAEWRRGFIRVSDAEASTHVQILDVDTHLFQVVYQDFQAC